MSSTRDDLVRVAGHFNIEVRGSPVKADLLEKLVADLREMGVLIKGNPVSPAHPSPGKIDFTPSKTALEWKRLELREKEVAWEMEKSQLEAERQAVRDRERREHELRMKDLEMRQAIQLKELEIQALQAGVRIPVDHVGFDVSRNINLVPPFNEKEVDKFFAHFERVATVLKWPHEVWPMTLQSIFQGKAQQAYASLSLEDAAEYGKVKQAVLHVYSLVPEACRQKFRNYQLISLSLFERKRCCVIVG